MIVRERVIKLRAELEVSIDKRLREYAVLENKRFGTQQLLTALSWKLRLDPDFPLIAALIGGTGTGKSTLFNSLVGRPISRVGIRRPCTLRPVVFLHEKWTREIARCPLIGPNFEPDPPESDSHVSFCVHGQPEWEGLILIDTPDFDSAERSNRLIADNLFVVGDIVLFVTSQEKYGDLTGLEVIKRARRWGKHTVVIMNKVVSDTAFDDFREKLRTLGEGFSDPIRIKRFRSSPEIITGLQKKLEFSELMQIGSENSSGGKIRTNEVENLREQTVSHLTDLEDALGTAIERVTAVNIRIDGMLSRTSEDMEERLDAVLTRDVESRVQDRLHTLLNKYDIFLTPRTMVRKAVRGALGLIADLLFRGAGEGEAEAREKKIRNEDIRTTRAMVKLKPLEWAIARFDLQVARLLSSDPMLEDLSRIAGNDVPGWGRREIRTLFDAAFPGVEQLLEKEFLGLKEGLSRYDEVKLYGSYTLWAVLLVTAEIVMGGGFTLLDAVLNTVVAPFIPKWLLSLKVRELLREIGRRVDQEYRGILKDILQRRAGLYTAEFRGLLPDDEAMGRVTELRKSLSADIAGTPP